MILEIKPEPNKVALAVFIISEALLAPLATVGWLHWRPELAGLLLFTGLVLPVASGLLFVIVGWRYRALSWRLAPAGIVQLRRGKPEREIPWAEVDSVQVLPFGTVVVPKGSGKKMRISFVGEYEGNLVWYCFKNASLLGLTANEWNDRARSEDQLDSDRKTRRIERGIGAVFLVPGVLLMIYGVSVAVRHSLSTKWPSVKGKVTRAEFDPAGDKAHFAFHYVVGGVTYTSQRPTLWDDDFRGDPRYAERLISKYPAGHQVDVYYDPKDPSIGVLQPGWDAFGSSVWTLLGYGLTLIGGLLLLRSHCRPTRHELIKRCAKEPDSA